MTHVLDMTGARCVAGLKFGLCDAMDIASQTEEALPNRVAIYRHSDEALPSFVLHLSGGAFYKYIWNGGICRHVMAAEASVYLHGEDILAEDWKVVVVKVPAMDINVKPVRDVLRDVFYLDVIDEGS